MSTIEPGSGYGIAKGTISYAADDDLLSSTEAWGADRRLGPQSRAAPLLTADATAGHVEALDAGT